MTFQEKVDSIGKAPLKARGISILQLNLGYSCNMSCRHCHVSGKSLRQKNMDDAKVRVVLSVLDGYDIPVLDLTGGAPELNPCFRDLVSEARKSGKHVIARTNLTVFFEQGMQDLPEFFGNNNVEIVASLPCYSADAVERVRGKGVFGKSIEALRILNDLGYGRGSDQKLLSLVHNPEGAFLPPAQGVLQQQYRQRLSNDFGISFDRLLTFVNMPIGRFRDFLVSTGNLESYMERLRQAFNPAALEHVMCRDLISVGWDGRLYCCDFNQALGLGMKDGTPSLIDNFDYDRLAEREISTGDHCFGCTAGHGST